MNKYVFIGGTGRSGSNILKSILSQHSDVASLPFEPRYILDPDGIIDYYNSLDSWSPYVIDFKLRRLFELLDNLGSRDQQALEAVKNYSDNSIDPLHQTPPRYYQWELDKHIPGFLERVEGLKAELVQFKFNNYWIGSESDVKDNLSWFGGGHDKSKTREVLSAFIKANYNALLSEKDKSVLVDDSTFSPIHIKELYDFIPEIKLIHIYRDPRDVVASLMQQRWAPGELGQVLSWYDSVVNRWEVVKQSVPKSCFIEIRFEDLVDNFSATMKLLSDFTNLDLRKLDNILDPSKHNIGRWKHAFNSDQKKIVQERLEDHLLRWDYL